MSTRELSGATGTPRGSRGCAILDPGPLDDVGRGTLVTPGVEDLELTVPGDSLPEHAPSDSTIAATSMATR